MADATSCPDYGVTPTAAAFIITMLHELRSEPAGELRNRREVLKVEHKQASFITSLAAIMATFITLVVADGMS